VAPRGLERDTTTSRVVEFTRATVEPEPHQLSGAIYPNVTFRLYFKHPDRTVGEQLWLIYPSVDPLHAERLCKWAEGLGAKIERTAPATQQKAPQRAKNQEAKRAEFF
jgi:hypothetical protein